MQHRWGDLPFTCQYFTAQGTVESQHYPHPTLIALVALKGLVFVVNAVFGSGPPPCARMRGTDREVATGVTSVRRAMLQDAMIAYCTQGTPCHELSHVSRIHLSFVNSQAVMFGNVAWQCR